MHPSVQYAFGHTRRLAHPDRRGEYENIGGQYLLAQRRPRVTFALVGFDAWLDVVIDDSNAGRFYPMRAERTQHLIEQFLRRRLFRTALERAVHAKRGELHRILSEQSPRCRQQQ